MSHPPARRTGLAPGIVFTLSHRYLDNGVFPAVVTVSDGDGGLSIRPFTVTVNNAAPVVSAGPDLTAPEGSPVVLRATVNDPGPNDTFTFRWSVVASNGQIISDGSGASFSFVPNDNGIYTVTVVNFSSSACTGTPTDRKSTRLNSSHRLLSRMPSSA